MKRRCLLIFCCLCLLLMASGCSLQTKEKKLRDVEYTVPPDRIVAGTCLYAAAATRGKIVLEHAPVEEMEAVLQVYEKMGGQWVCNSGKLKADAREIRYPVSMTETARYPGFPTDMQSILMAVLLTVHP